MRNVYKVFISLHTWLVSQIKRNTASNVGDVLLCCSSSLDSHITNTFRQVAHDSTPEALRKFCLNLGKTKQFLLFDKRLSSHTRTSFLHCDMKKSFSFETD